MTQSIGPETYDREYFLSETCEGWDEFRRGEVSFNKAKQVERLAPAPGLKILDAGCGRGEVMLACARRGATVAGVDFSEAAVEISRELLAEYSDADIRQGDVTDLPWPDASFDRIQNSDVIEHLDPEQTVPALREFHRVLKPGGYLLIHTAPNRLFKEVAWPLAAPALRLLGHGEMVAEMQRWFQVNKLHHPNEQSLFSMRRALREAGFGKPVVWIDPDVLRSGNYRYTSGLDGPLMAVATRLASTRPLRLLLGNDIFGLARK